MPFDVGQTRFGKLVSPLIDDGESGYRKCHKYISGKIVYESHAPQGCAPRGDADRVDPEG